MCVCLSICQCNYVCGWERDFFFFTCLHPSVTFLSPRNVKSSTCRSRYLGQCETPQLTRWKTERGREWETDRERNNEIDGPHEVMTAGRPHSMMDDKWSASMCIGVPRHISVNTAQVKQDIKKSLCCLIKFAQTIPHTDNVLWHVDQWWHSMECYKLNSAS